MKTCSIIILTLTSLISNINSSFNNHNHNSFHTKRFIKSVRNLDDSNAESQRSIDTKDSEKRDLEKRTTYSGQATYFNPGLGSCGAYSSSSDFIVALDQSLYGNMGAVSPFCFKQITIYANGKSHGATIVDACPSENGGCQYGSLDMSPALFNYFSTPDAGVFQMSWSVGGEEPAPSPSPSKTPEPKSTSVYVEPTPTSTPEPTTSYVPTTTYTPPSSSEVAKTTTVAPSFSAISTTLNNTTLPLSSTSLNSSSIITTSTTFNATSPLVQASPQATGSVVVHPSGNLNTLSQIVLGLGGLLSATAHQYS